MHLRTIFSGNPVWGERAVVTVVSEKELEQRKLTTELTNAKSKLQYVAAQDETEILKNYPLYQEFLNLLDKVLREPALFSKQEQERLIKLTECTTLKITDPNNQQNDQKYDDLMSEVYRVSADKAKAYWSPRAHFWGKVAICVSGIVAVAALMVGTWALTAALSLIDPLLGLAGLMVGIGVIGVAVTQLSKAYQAFKKHHNNQNAYLEFNKKQEKESKPCFFSASVPKVDSAVAALKPQDNQSEEQPSSTRPGARTTSK